MPCAIGLPMLVHPGEVEVVWEAVVVERPPCGRCDFRLLIWGLVLALTASLRVLLASSASSAVFSA